MAEIFEVEEKIIETIRKRRNEFMDKYMMRKLNEEGFKFIDKIYNEKRFDAVSGEQAQRITI
jgi:hypothetical protein